MGFYCCLNTTEQRLLRKMLLVWQNNFLNLTAGVAMMNDERDKQIHKLFDKILKIGLLIESLKSTIDNLEKQIVDIEEEVRNT